ncbi:hypothetical protein FB565_000129 [Actinoplanes lutulentus]|uniref:hypothetical protein n=1 Tax=Actinoplanes lutulentus TaxID=1287878 RepID=UPI0017BA064D|nr:hypothetical protein [Actinoplanes lutulentus]MBB2940425.1 hypothetical protein [Actinoplanes lutulentus]
MTFTGATHGSAAAAAEDVATDNAPSMINAAPMAAARFGRRRVNMLMMPLTAPLPLIYQPCVGLLIVLTRQGERDAISVD